MSRCATPALCSVARPFSTRRAMTLTVIVGSGSFGLSKSGSVPPASLRAWARKVAQSRLAVRWQTRDASGWHV